MESYQARIKHLNKIGAKYLGLSAQGLFVYSAWLLPDGKIVHVDLD